MIRKMERYKLMDQIEEIQDRANEENIGSNEAELQMREDVADLIIELARRVEVLEDTVEACIETYSTIMPSAVKRLLEGAL